MLGHDFCLAAVVAVTMLHSPAADSSSICNTAENCYVDESSSKVCNRTEKKCNRCLITKENTSILSKIGGWTEYICYDVDDNGDCPTKTIKCPATLKTSDDSEEHDESTRPKPADSDESFTEKPLLSPSNSSSMSISQSYLPPKKTKISLLLNDSSGSSATPEMKKPTTQKMRKSATKSSTLPMTGDELLAADDAHYPTFNSTQKPGFAFETLDPALQTSVGTVEPEEDENVSQSSISSAVTPALTTPIDAESTPMDTVISDKFEASNTARGDSGLGSNHTSLILGIIGAAAAVLAFAGFVVWRKKENDEDSDDEDAAFSPTKLVTGRNMASLPSADSGTTVYLAQSSHYENSNSYAHHSNIYGNTYDSSCDNNYTATQYAAAAGMASASYGSPHSIDIDGENEIRRTDSILGGTGVMLSTTSSMQTPFEFSGGPSPANSDMSQDIWGDEMGSSHQKYTASSASVEF